MEIEVFDKNHWLSVLISTDNKKETSGRFKGNDRVSATEEKRVAMPSNFSAIIDIERQVEIGIDLHKHTMRVCLNQSTSNNGVFRDGEVFQVQTCVIHFNVLVAAIGRQLCSNACDDVIHHWQNQSVQHLIQRL